MRFTQPFCGLLGAVYAQSLWAGSIAPFLPFDSVAIKQEVVQDVPLPSPAIEKPVNGFVINGDSGVPAMHAALLQDGRVVFLDKVESSTGLKLSTGRYAYSSIYDPASKQVVPLRVQSNAFCAAGGFLADGRLLAIGGNEPLTWLDPTVGDGLQAIQILDFTAPERGWTEPTGHLASKRWYATAQVLEDGKIFVAAGTSNGTVPYAIENINPTFEILNATAASDGNNIRMDLLVKNAPYWMYPFVHLLKDGNIFVFVSKSSQIFSVMDNRVIKQLPDLIGMFRTYPNTGGSVMLPLKPQNDFTPSIMICGGGGWQGIDSPGDSTCGIIEPMSTNPAWTIVKMPEPRCMVEGILLLDGSVLWINGVSRGAQGFGLSDIAVQEAIIYHPETGTWTNAGKSTIARVYHSVALMLLDGTILVAGSNPNEMPIWLKDVDPSNQYRKFPTEVRLETWVPPYLQGDNARNRPFDVVIDHTQLKARRTTFRVSFKSPKKPEKAEVIMYHGGFVTHSLHMGQVMVNLETGPLSRRGDTETVLARIPDIALAPGPYVVYVMVNGIPSVGQFINLIAQP